MPNTAPQDRYIVPALHRRLELLGKFNRDSPSLNGAELSRQLGLPRASVFRMLHTLETSGYLDRDLGFIHEAPAQLAMLQSVSKAAFRIRNPVTALVTLREAYRPAFTAPCGPVSMESQLIYKRR